MPPTMRSAAPAGGPVAKRLFAREQKLAAREALEASTPAALSDPVRRVDVLRALAMLGAEPELVEEVSRVR